MSASNDASGSLDRDERINDAKEDRTEPKSSLSTGVIQILSNEVVQQIAAGEVVQRASSAIKELLENAIDAAADTIRVTVTTSAACPSFSVVDNGTGIAQTDLSLACTRHATSKIRTYQDLRSISSFGFRGEALAALSMVSRVTITSKTASSNETQSACAYQMQYSNGRPNSEEPTRTARTVGTTIQVNDLFYNLPHRQSSNKSSASTEYQSILKVLQSYAIHHAAQGIAISCQKQGTAVADVNTAPFVAAVQKARRTSQRRPDVTLADDTSSDSENEATVRALQEAATRSVIGHTFGSHLIPFLLPHSSSLYGNERRNVTASAPAKCINPFDAFETDDEKKEDEPIASDVAGTERPSSASSDKRPSLIYSCTGYITSPSFFQSSDLKKKVGLHRPNPIVLFINHRFIEGCSVLRRSVEDVYVKCCKQKPPFLYLSIHVPPDTIDVNVHPTKREVVLLHMEEIRTHLAQHVKEQLESVGYTVPNIAPPVDPPPPTRTIHPYHTEKKRKLSQSQIAVDAPAVTTEELKPDSNRTAPPVILPKNKIRTSRTLQSGSLEPFLVRRSSLSQETQSQPYVSESQNDIRVSSQEEAATGSPSSTPDEPASGPAIDTKCPLHDVDNSTPDLSTPGAFATLAALCNCPKKVPLDLSQAVDSQVVGFPIRLASQTVSAASTSNAAAAGRALRLQRQSPTSCSYTSIQQLRKRTFSKYRDEAWEKKLRGACFVGTVSHHRTLMQCDEELVLMNHFACAQELFYQIALNRFGGGCGVAKVPGKAENRTTSGIDIESVIGHFVQMEEQLHQPSLNLDDVSSWSLPIKISETNQALANQAAACLLQYADMLLEYYSIQIEKDSSTGKSCLTGLPILIEGFEPSPHGLPLFLLRLASEVDWSEEKSCFHGICRELGSFYAQLPADGSREDHAARVQHTLFPAITTLLIPTKDMKQKNDFVTLTSLPKLFRVFERC